MRFIFWEQIYGQLKKGRITMKKIITLFSALVLAAFSCVTVSAKEIPRNPDGSVVQYTNQLTSNSPLGSGHAGFLQRTGNQYGKG